jgi:TolA-binding protein
MGLTDEQQVLAIVGQDLLTSSIQLYQIKGMQKELLEHACDITKQLEVNTANKNQEIRQKDNEIADMKRRIEEMQKKELEYQKINNQQKENKIAKKEKAHVGDLGTIKPVIDEVDAPFVDESQV